MRKHLNGVQHAYRRNRKHQYFNQILIKTPIVVALFSVLTNGSIRTKKPP